MNNSYTLLADSVNAQLQELVDRPLQESVERGLWPEQLWQRIQDMGYAEVLLMDAEDQPWQQMTAILAAAGRHALPLPLAETMLARYCVMQANCCSQLDSAVFSTAPATVMTAMQAQSPNTLAALENGEQRLSGIWRQVTFARHCHFALVQLIESSSSELLVIDLKQNRTNGTARIEEHNSVCGEPHDTVILTDATVYKLAGKNHPVLRYLACMRSVMMAAALQAVLDESVKYAGERVQFGRNIGKFQAIQHALAQLAGEVASAQMSVEFAIASMAGSTEEFAIACAKVRCGEAAGRAAAIAHQVHGAMGFTREHNLHYLTRRLWTWRADYGDEAWWAEQLGSAAINAAHSGFSFWPWLTRGDQPSG